MESQRRPPVDCTHPIVPGIATVIINFNSYEEVKRCVESLKRVDYGQSLLVCVDNGSTDDSRERLIAEFPEVVHIANGGNLGFGSGMNAGIRKALNEGCDYVFCFNSDTWVDDPRLFDKLLAPFRENPKMGVVGPVEYDYTGSVLLYSGPTGRHKFELKVSGAAFFVSRKVFESVGLLDESFFLGYEDQDLLLRAERSGFRVQIVPGARFMHKRSAFTTRYSRMMVYLEARNEVIFYARHWDLASIMKRVFLENFRRVPGMALASAKEKRPELLTALIRGILRGISYMPKAKQPGTIPQFDSIPWTLERSR